MSITTLSDLLDSAARRCADRRTPAQDHVLDQREDIEDFIRSVMAKDAEAWNRITDEKDDISEAYARGRAHALSEIIGDQPQIHGLFKQL